MTTFSSSDREVIRFLFKREDWADLYDLHEEFGLSPAQVLDIVERLAAVNFADLDGIKSRLTPAGREWIVAAREDIFFGTDNGIWRPMGDELLAAAIGPSSPYLPDLHLIDRRFFIKLALENDVESAKD